MANKGKTPINAGRPVYFSYARNNDTKPEWKHISDCVDIIIKKFQQENIEYRLDVRDLITGDRISGFEKEIGHKSETVVIVFSDRYFRSMHCMNELIQIQKSLKTNPNKRLLLIKCGDFNLADMHYIRDLEKFWTAKKNEYDEIKFHRIREFSSTEKAAEASGYYLDKIRELYSFFSAYNYFDASKGNWDNFVNDVIKYYTNTPKPETKSSKVAEVKKSVAKPKKKSRGWLWIVAALLLVFVFFGYGYYRAHRFPFTITSCSVMAQDGKENLKIEYFSPQTRPFELYIKVFDPNGNLIIAADSPVGYSLKKYVAFEQGYGEAAIEEVDKILSGRNAGDYRFELYFHDRQIDSYTFELPAAIGE